VTRFGVHEVTRFHTRLPEQRYLQTLLCRPSIQKVLKFLIRLIAKNGWNVNSIDNATS